MLSKANVSLTFMKAPDLIFLWSKSVINRTLFGPQTAEDVEIHRALFVGAKMKPR